MAKKTPKKKAAAKSTTKNEPAISKNDTYKPPPEAAKPVVKPPEISTAIWVNGSLILVPEDARADQHIALLKRAEKARISDESFLIDEIEKAQLVSLLKGNRLL